MSKELKTPAEVTEAQENDKKEQATLTFFSLDSLTYKERFVLLRCLFDEPDITNLYCKVLYKRRVVYDDLVFLISLLDERIVYLSSLQNSSLYDLELKIHCKSALDKIQNMLADVSTELNSSEPEPKEQDREEEKHVEEVHPKKYLTPVEIDVLKKALDNYKHLCCFELRDSEVITDKSLYKQELKEFRLTVDLLSDLANVRNVIFERTEFFEVPDEDEMPF